jgi:hypothetical protein
MSIKNTMLEFKSLGKFTIAGRGSVFVVENDRERKEDFEDLYPRVKIDGKEYKVRGVESRGMTQYKGDELGLLISEVEDEG